MNKISSFWLLIIISVFLLLLTPLYSQTQWQKYPDPVLNVGTPGSWDETLSVATTILFHENIYKMWYEGDGGFGYATSQDGFVWTKDTVHNPILEPGPPGAWDHNAINHASVLFVDNTYHMWYSGEDANEDNQIGHATSPDGITWAKDSANPVLSFINAGIWDNQEIIHPSVIWEEGTFKMWYNGYGNGTQRILYATSLNGTNWIRYYTHPMLEPGTTGSWDDNELGPLCVIHVNDVYHMWYTGWNNSAEPLFQIGYARSDDGIDWHKSSGNPVLSPGGATDWDSVMIAIPVVISENDSFRMWYGGNDGFKFRTGHAIPPDTTIYTGLSGESNYSVARNFQLYQNYPNPFNPITSIQFFLPNTEFVTLIIYDLTGKKVATLINEKMPMGNHNIKWDAANFPSGVYFYSIQTELYKSVKKMILLK